MPKRIKGTLKSDLPGPEGYRAPWETGKASFTKRIQKIKGMNRPSN